LAHRGIFAGDADDAPAQTESSAVSFLSMRGKNPVSEAGRPCLFF
jgi:hypothetical protein